MKNWRCSAGRNFSGVILILWRHYTQTSVETAKFGKFVKIEFLNKRQISNTNTRIRTSSSKLSYFFVFWYLDWKDDFLKEVCEIHNFEEIKKGIHIREIGIDYAHTVSDTCAARHIYALCAWLDMDYAHVLHDIFTASIFYGPKLWPDLTLDLFNYDFRTDAVAILDIYSPLGEFGHYSDTVHA